MRQRLRVKWTPQADRDFEERRRWSQHQAQRVLDAVYAMAAEGWRLGRNSVEFPGYKWWPVPPLGVLYQVEGDILTVAHVFHMSKLRELP